MGELASRIRQLTEAPELRRKMGQQGRQALQTRYTIDKMTDATVKLYEDVLGA